MKAASGATPSTQRMRPCTSGLTTTSPWAKPSPIGAAARWGMWSTRVTASSTSSTATHGRKRGQGLQPAGPGAERPDRCHVGRGLLHGQEQQVRLPVLLRPRQGRLRARAFLPEGGRNLICVSVLRLGGTGAKRRLGASCPFGLRNERLCFLCWELRRSSGGRGERIPEHFGALRAAAEVQSCRCGREGGRRGPSVLRQAHFFCPAQYVCTGVLAARVGQGEVKVRSLRGVVPCEAAPNFRSAFHLSSQRKAGMFRVCANPGLACLCGLFSRWSVYIERNPLRTFMLRLGGDFELALAVARYEP